MNQGSARYEGRILQILSCEPKKDGLTRVALEVGNALQDRYAVEYCAPCAADNPVATKLQQDGSVFHFLPAKRNLLKYMRKIYRTVSDGGFDAVYIHGNSAMMIAEALPAHAARVPVVAHCHNTSTNHPILHAMLKPLFNQMIKGKIGCSVKAGEWAYTGEGIYAIPNGIDTEKYLFRPEKRQEIREKLGLGDAVIIGMAGRLSRQKNPLFALSVFQEIHKTNRNAKLLIVGDGELHNAVTEFITANGLQAAVILLGQVDDPENYYQAMDLLLVPSLYEGLPLSVLEAQACGLPVLLSEVCSPEIYTLDTVTCGKLSDGAKAWADAALALILMERKRTGGSDVLQEKGFTIQRMTDRIGEVVEAVIKDSHAKRTKAD